MTDIFSPENQPSQDSTTTNSRTLPIEFRGDGTEYFKIWIVNILLSILTLGIYSAWATVRNRRYFYSNLYLDDSYFSYLAQPLTILRGRIIAVILFGGFVLLSNQYIEASIGLSLLLMFAVPFIINQSLAFERRMSSYRNIQFRFKGTYGQALMVIYVYPLLGILSLGIAYPLVLLRTNEYIMKNTSYGTTSFDFNATFKDYGIIFLTMLGAGLVFGGIVLGVTSFIPGAEIVAPIISVLVYFGLIVYFMVSTANTFYQNLSLANHQFDSSITIPDFTAVLFTNLFFTLITLGLYLPAAKVRMTKYICSRINLQANGSLDGFFAAEKESVGAFGDEFGEVFDLGI